MNNIPQVLPARISGLDSLRALAIALVLVYHYMVVASGKPTFGIVTEVGWAGVDLFFVLSGYLIGNQIMSALARGERLALGSFYVRRLLRTLPNYYVVLGLYFMFPLFMAGKLPGSIWPYLAFTQNIGMRAGSVFSYSWSLNIEEQFYLVLPAISLLFAATGRSVRWAWTVLGMVMVCAMCSRGWMWLQCRDFGASYMTAIYYSSFCRADELLPGVALAMLKNFHPGAYARLLKKGNLALALGAGLSLATLGLFYGYLGDAYVDAHGYNVYLTVFGYPLLAVSFALLVFSALSPDSMLNRMRISGAAQLALWSYAIYLTHKPVFYIVKNIAQNYGLDLESIPVAVIIVAAGVIGGYLLYRFVESPFMRLREGYFPARTREISAQAAQV